MSKRLQFPLGAIFFTLLLIYAGGLFYSKLGLLQMRSDPGWMPIRMGARMFVGQINGSESGALQTYDEVIALNGQPLSTYEQFTTFFGQAEPASRYTLVFRRGNQLQQALLSTTRIPARTWLVRFALYLIIPNIFLITGLVVFLLKPHDKQAFLLALMFGMFTGAFAAAAPSYDDAGWLRAAVMLIVQLISLFLWPVFFHFFLIFPEPAPLLRRIPRLEFYLYGPHLLVIFPYLAILNILTVAAPEKAFTFSQDFTLLRMAGIGLMVLYIASGLLSLMVNYREARTASRRRMRIIVAGSIAGFLPFFLTLGLAFLFDLQEANPNLLRGLVIAAYFAFPLFPLSFAYAIIRHQVIPVRLMLRRSVRYLLISRGFIIVQAIVVFAVLSFLLTGSRIEAIDRLGERADIIATMAATALAIAVLALVNQQVMPRIDRRFFREAYDAHRVLSELGMAMRTVATIDQLLQLTVAKIQDALHTENVIIFLCSPDTGDYDCAIASRLAEDGLSAAELGWRFALPGDGLVAERLKQATAPVPVDLEISRSWLHPAASRDAETEESRNRERQTLQRIRSALLLPVSTKDQLLGIISLGPRLGDLPFSGEDRQLLMAVAVQMAFGVQNAQLVEQIAGEERLRHELEIATAVQRRLFPERPPQLERLDLCGVCHPARGVGGDYYDFILLDDNKVGIAVADVAGKGISAALLMSTVQASLRSQARSVNGNLTDLVSSMNRLMHVSTDASSYATFFYAEFDEATNRLTYVNAGHNPPLLVRSRPALKAQGVGQAAVAGRNARTFDKPGFEAPLSEVTPLTTGGPIIGAFDDCVYHQETVALQSEDLLVAFTDGLTEALNAADEEYGEERLRELIITSGPLSAQTLSERIVEDVREWCGDTPQHDDLTLVVARVKS